MYQSTVTEGSPTRVRLRDRLSSVKPLFLITVVIPTLVAIIYFGFLASDVYISESQFVVRRPDKPSKSGLSLILNDVGFASAGDEAFITHDYVKSRDALRSLNTKGAVTASYTNPSIAVVDRFNPFGWDGSFEDLVRYYRRKVEVNYDSTSSITTLSVKAYSPEDARRMNRELLDLSEDLVNRLNNRGEVDLLGNAQAEARDAELAARRASEALGAFRQQSGIVDPERQATVQIQLVSKLQDELIGARIQLQQIQSLAPENPQIPLLRTRISELQKQVDLETGRAAGSQRSLSAAAVRYQRLSLDREYADKRLAAALASLQEARNESRQKQAYVERIVEANLPDEAQEPRRLRGIFATLILGLVAYGILVMLLAGVREHRD